MNTDRIVEQIIEYLGGTENILTVTNCMTRLRIVTKEEEPVNESGLKEMTDVLGLVHDRERSYEVVVGPGKSRKYADVCHAMGLPSAAGNDRETAGDDWKQNKDKIKSSGSDNRLKSGLKVIGDIFVPLIPGVIAAGLCAGAASLITQLIPGYANMPLWNTVYALLSLINTSFMTYITAWAGYRAAERFGATPILGGMLGLITSLEGINTIAVTLGLYDEAQPLQSVLRTGRGGVLAVIVGVYILSFAEKKIRNHMPDSVDIVFTPLLSLITVSIPYILLIMPLFGYVSSAIVWAFGKACMANSPVVRLLTGFLASALFLPLVAAGMHHGLVALYSVQLQEIGYITLYPALAMAGAGQVGASLAIMKKAGQKNNKRLISVIRGALPAGFLGVGEPLIYGVTLPLGKPFITAGIGAGFGGAFVMLMQVASTTWGPSGLLGIFVMTQGPRGPISSIACYLIGLLISYVMSYVITNLFVKADEVTPSVPVQPFVISDDTLTPSGDAQPAADTSLKPSVSSLQHYKRVRYGDPISFEESASQYYEFSHTVKDPLGIHARPAGELSKLIRKHDCRFVIEANGHCAENGSIIQLMSLGAVQGSTLKCRAEGPDAAAAIAEVRDFLEKKL